MPKLQCAAGILVHEDTLDRDDIGPILAHYLAHGFEDLPQPVRKAASSAVDRAARDVGRGIALEIENAEPGQARAWINAEYASFISQLVLKAAPVRLR